MRTSTSVLATFISLGLAGFATSTASAQNTLTVCPNGCDFTSIAQAYSAASDDDVIEIGPGVYPTSLTINGSDKPLTFVGTISSEGGPATVLQPVSDGEGILRFWGVSGLTFRDLEFSGCSGRPAASFFNECNLRFEHCIFRDNEGTGTGGEFGGAVHSNGSFPTFVSCQFLGNSDPRGGAVFAKNGGHARFYDCILIGNTATVSGFTGSQHNVGAIWWNDDLHGSPFQGVLMTIDGCVICDNIQSGPQITVDGYQGSDNCILTSCGLDSDGDLAPDSCDLFPADPTEFNDSDGDGVGNNADICPGHDDSLDADFDGVPDGCDVCPGYDDSFDADSDGTPDGCDGCPDDDTKSDPGQCGCFVPDTDSDGDGTADCIDGCPDDGNKTEAGVCGCGVPDTDSDSDGIPDCIDNCPDTSNQDQANTDGDSHGDACDAFPDDPTETLDSDGDGVGDNADDFPNDDSETTDSDGDGVGDNADEFPNDDSETTDTDGDGVGDNADVCPGYNDITSLDSDEDGVPDVCDALPYDPTETMDSDGDGVGDNADDLPYDPTETVDSDGDGAGNGIDLWPDDPSEWSDYDGDGIGDNADEDQISVCANGCDFTSIAQAYSAASDDDVIVVGPGAYSTSLTINGSDKPLTFVGTISSEGGPATVLQPVSDGEGILRFWGVSDLTFRDLEFSGCSGRPAASFFNESTLRFEHCIFRDNEGTGTGGEFGGAVHSNRSFPTFVSCQFLGNSDPRGGAVFAKNGGHARFYDCILIGNTATVSGFTGSQHNVGAIWWNDDLHGSPFQGVLMTIDGCVICDNIQSGPQITVDGYQGSDNCISAVCDSDEDGVLDCYDGCPDDSNKTEPGLCGCGVVDSAVDSDDDGTLDCNDAFPNDDTETVDSDGDGVGDNADAFPNDDTETADSDGDGVGDNADAFPNDDTETVDSDGDGVGDNADAFPNDDTETEDSDGDGVGDNADAFPNDDTETVDSDNDGVGDNADAFPDDDSETTDSDGDGVGDNADLCAGHDDTVDCDGDGIPDGCAEEPGCPGDVTGDQIVDGADLAAVLAAWGFDVPEVEQSGDDLIDGQDLGIVLGAWGLPCDLPDDPGVCGDGSCDAGETADCCPVDCDVADPCGGGICGITENFFECPLDCENFCGDGGVPDCNEFGMCWPVYWIGDAYCDGPEPVNLCCYDLDGGDCTALECNIDFCGDGICGITENFSECPLDCENFCGDGGVPDCNEFGMCWPVYWIGDAYCDGPEPVNLCCYDLDGGDCTALECNIDFCGDGICGITENFSECPLDCENFCGDGGVPDCNEFGMCWPVYWIGDAYCDGPEPVNLCCYDLDGGDCTPWECE